MKRRKATAPEHLDPVAIAKWRELMPILQERGNVDQGVLDSLTAYAVAYSQIAAKATALQEKLGEEARGRMLAGKKPAPGVTLPEGRVRDQMGKAVGVSGSLVDRGAKVEPIGSVHDDDGGRQVSTIG